MGKIVKIVFVYSLLFVFASCGTNTDKGFLTIPVGSVMDTPLSLSEIAGNVEAFELELTEQSLISRVKRVFHTEDYIFICGSKYIMLFDKTGKFIRQIGSVGQGPGEFTTIADVAADMKNKLLFILASGKIICYDFDGNLMKESSSGSYGGGIKYLYYVDDALKLLVESVVTLDGNKKKQTVLYTLDDNLLKSDSVEVHTIDSRWIWNNLYDDFISYDGENVYLYYPDLSQNTFILDTLYRLNNRKLTPYLNLSFTNNGLNTSGEKNIYIMNIYKSSRYVFSNYMLPVPVNERRNPECCLCYDTKTGKCYNMKEGYKDDIHTGEVVKIRPFDSDSNMFYYLHTDMDDSVKEEPNPTLYIGTLKK